MAMAADDAMTRIQWFQAIRDSCGLLCSKKLFMTVDDMSVMCCSLCYVTY